jgi:hypothetical protein
MVATQLTGDKTMQVTIELDVTDAQCAAILTTAVEGGMDYWADVLAVNRDDDLNVLSCELRDVERDGGRCPRWTANLDTVRLGLKRLLGGGIKYGNRANLLRDLVEDELFCRTDAGDADCVVQAGLFNDIVYG